MSKSDGWEIRVGDKVLCIDDRSDFNHLRHGTVYTVENKLEYAIGVCGRMYSPERFERVAE